MTDEVDSFVPQTLGKYADKDFRSVTQEDLGLSTDEEKKEAAEQAEKSKATLEFVKTTLGDAVKEVRLSDNLGTHPVCMVPEEGMTFEMEKYFQRLNPEMGMKAEQDSGTQPEPQTVRSAAGCCCTGRGKGKEDCEDSLCAGAADGGPAAGKPRRVHRPCVRAGAVNQYRQKKSGCFASGFFYASGNQAISRSFLFCRY